MTLLFLFLPFFIFPSSQAEQTIRFQAANTSILRDVNHGLHFANFVKHKSKYLNTTPFMSLLVPNEKKCQILCLKELQCLSFNVAVFTNSDGQFKCELLATDMFNSSTNMTDNANYHHYNLQTVCNDRPCTNNGTCKPDYKTNTYSCQCQCPYYGKHCQKDLARTWSPWTECIFNGPLPEATRNRTRSYSNPDLVPSVCPERNDTNQVDTETQSCSTILHPGCDSPLGMEDGRIKDSQITASSSHNAHYSPPDARLNKSYAPWCTWLAGFSKNGEYLTIDLGTVMKITKIATQGSGCGYTSIVTRYRLQYRTDNTTWTGYYSPQFIKVFPGNTPQNVKQAVNNTIEIPFKARYVRIVVVEHIRTPTMRVELYGCPV